MAPDRVLVVGENQFDFHRLDEKGPQFESVLGDAGFDVDVTTDRDAFARARLAEYAVAVDFLTDPPVEHADALRTFVRDGGGFVGIHNAADVSTFVDQPADEIAALLGARFVDHPEQSTFGVRIVDDYPITAGVDDFEVFDEPYELRMEDADDRHLLAEMDHPEMDGMPVAWTRTEGDGRVFYCSLGHTDDAFEHPAVRRLLAQGVAWVTGE
jgi:type 1 glutamine amidotransferase